MHGLMRPWGIGILRRAIWEARAVLATGTYRYGRAHSAGKVGGSRQEEVNRELEERKLASRQSRLSFLPESLGDQFYPLPQGKPESKAPSTKPFS